MGIVTYSRNLIDKYNYGCKKMDVYKWKRWVDVSIAPAKIEPFFVPIIQGLGRIDSKLIFEEAVFSNLSPTKQSTIKASVELTDLFTYSYLWVLGLYELVRTLDNRCVNSPEVLGENLNKKLKAFKHKTERLRMPLAKMEPAKRNKKTDYSIAFPALHKTLGISWHIAEKTYISRRELSDEILNLLEEIKCYISRR